MIKDRFDTSNIDLNNRDDMKIERDLLNKENIKVPFSEVHKAFSEITSVADVTKETETQNCNPEIESEMQKTDRNCKASAELDNCKNRTENLKSLHQIQSKEFCNSSVSDMDNVITGTGNALMQDNVKLESVLINIIRNAPNETASIADTKSQISDSSRYNFNSELGKQLSDDNKNEENAMLGTKVDKQELPNSVNQITSIYTNKKNKVSDAHVSEVHPYPYALSDCNMDTAADTGRNIHNIVCKMECDESYATVDERPCSTVDIPVLSTAHSETNASTAQYNKLYNKSTGIFTHLEFNEGLSVIKEVKMLSSKKCNENLLDSSLHCNALNCTATNGSLTERISLSSNTTVNKILCSDKPNYWSIGISSTSGNIKTESFNLLNIKTEKSADSKIPNSDVSKHVNDISSVSLNIKTETTADNEIPNCKIENLSTVDSPDLLNIKIEKTEDRKIPNCDIPKYCSIDIPSSLNIETEASSATLSNKDCSAKIFENSSTVISDKCGLNRKKNSYDSVANFQTTSKESKITSCVRKFSEIGSHKVVFDKEPKPSTSKVNILSTTPKSTLASTNTAPEDLNRIFITTSSNGSSSAEVSTNSVIEEKFNDESYKNKKFGSEDSVLCNLLTCSQNNIFRLAGSSVCPVTKGRHTKLVLQSYKCHKCNETFFTEKQLELHQIAHASKYSLGSTVCDKQFVNGKSHHIRSVVQPEPETKDMKFLENLQENIHHRQEGKVSILKTSKLHSNIENKMLSEEAVITYKCDQCNEKFRFKPNVQPLTVPLQQPMFQCSTCSKRFNSYSAYKSHGKEFSESSTSESETDEPYDECHICGFKPWVPSRRTLRKHMSVHSKARPYKCDQCEKTFTSKKYLSCHRQLHINGEPVTCKICGKSLKNKSSLNSHLRIHKVKSLSEKCHLCDGKFSTLAELKRHYMKHTGEKPYSCDICGKSFRMANTLGKHLSVHSNDKYLCEICGKEFRSTHHLARHRSVHLNGKQFKCKVCSKMFNYETNLKQHLLTHSDKRNYACKLCDKKFKRPHHLRQHQQTHK